jgi:hypothetical protein
LPGRSRLLGLNSELVGIGVKGKARAVQPQRRLTTAVVLTVLLTTAMMACGSQGGRSISSLSRAKLDQVPADSREQGPLDPDDDIVLSFGKAAGPTESREIARLLRRYYVAAASERVATACSMLYSVAVRSILEEERRPLGHIRDRCRSVVGPLFAHQHRDLLADVKSFRIIRIRTQGTDGRVVLRVPSAFKAREIDIRRVGHSWRVAQALDGAMP